MVKKKEAPSKKQLSGATSKAVVGANSDKKFTKTASIEKHEAKEITISSPIVMECLSILRKIIHSGFLPSPEDVAKYKKIDPSFIEWFQKTVKRVHIFMFIERFGGQLLAFILGVGFLFVASRVKDSIPLTVAASTFSLGILLLILKGRR